MKTHKHCPHCRQTKPRAAFHVSRKASDGLASYCKPCKKALKPKLDANYNARRDVTAKNLKARYGITPDERAALLTKQAGGCAICGKPGELVVDHCHTTGRVRGLLCVSCNVMIGHAGDNPDTLRRAVAYLDSDF